MSLEFQSMEHLKIIPPEGIPQEDGLALMLRLQKDLNQNIYPIVTENLRIPIEKEEVVMTIEEWQEAMTKEYLLAIIREACEALDMINSKPWRKTEKEIDVRELKFELIDMQHFQNSLYDIWGMNREEILGIFLAKYDENIRRNKSGY